MNFAMNRFGLFITLPLAAIIVSVARGGHELPIYPSFYPHEIEIQDVAPEQAGGLLSEGKIQAYVGGVPKFSGTPPDFIRAIDSLGSFVIVRVNSRWAAATASDCAIVSAVVADMAGRGGNFIFHPYPITPLHGDYLYHADLASAARERFAAHQAESASLKIKAADSLTQALVRSDRLTSDSDWDAEVVSVDALDLVKAQTVTINALAAPPWARYGWFHAELLLSDATDDDERAGAEARFQRLSSGAFDNLVERVNLERDLVASLTAGCRKVVVGYTVKREYVNAEYTVGIENVGYDAIDGLNSPMFLRTVKLKDFPWNGWLGLGVNGHPTAAWNPIAGMNDPFGRLLWSAVGDPALIPAPYDAGWMLNRFSGVQSNGIR